MLCALAARRGPAPASLQPQGKQDLLRRQRHRQLGRLRPVQRRPAQAPGADRELPHLGLGLPRLDRALAGGPGAAGPAHHHRRLGDGHELISPRAIAQGDGDEIPAPPQQALLGEEDARLHAAAGRAQPLPQRLRLLRLRRQPARRRPQAALVPARLPPHLHPRSTAAASAARSTPPRRSRAAAAARRRRRPAAGAGRGRSGARCRPARRRCPQNRPKYFYPGDEYVDWVGTDFYSDNQDWKSLTGLYNRFSTKPFAIPEFGVSSGDDPRYMEHLMTWVSATRAARCSSTTRTSARPAPTGSRTTRPASPSSTTRLHSKRFPAFAPGHPHAAAAARRAGSSPVRRRRSRRAPFAERCARSAALGRRCLVPAGRGRVQAR